MSRCRCGKRRRQGLAGQHAAHVGLVAARGRHQQQAVVLLLLPELRIHWQWREEEGEAEATRGGAAGSGGRGRRASGRPLNRPGPSLPVPPWCRGVQEGGAARGVEVSRRWGESRRACRIGLAGWQMAPPRPVQVPLTPQFRHRRHSATGAEPAAPPLTARRNHPLAAPVCRVAIAKCYRGHLQARTTLSSIKDRADGSSTRSNTMEKSGRLRCGGRAGGGPQPRHWPLGATAPACAWHRQQTNSSAAASTRSWRRKVATRRGGRLGSGASGRWAPRRQAASLAGLLFGAGLRKACRWTQWQACQRHG